MLYVKNTSGKILGGLGSLILLPGDSGKLPKGFDKSHNTVSWYIEQGYLTVVDGGEEANRRAEAARAEADRLAAEKKEAENKAAEAAAEADRLAAEQAAEAERAANLEKKLKEVGKMNLDPLKEEAAALGIEFPEDATKAVLVDLITKKLTAG